MDLYAFFKKLKKVKKRMKFLKRIKKLLLKLENSNLD